MTGLGFAAIVRAVSAPPPADDPELSEWPQDGIVTVFDLEYTAWSGSQARGWSEPWEHKEVIQIGAVDVDAGAGFETRGSFSVLVRPVRNPRLSDYITELTGITDAMIAADGVGLAEALDGLADFAEGPLLNFGGDGMVLRGNCTLVGIAMPLAPGCIVNLGPALCRALGADYWTTSSSDLPTLAGLDVPGRRHDALADAHAIAAVMRSLRSNSLI